MENSISGVPSMSSVLGSVVVVVVDVEVLVVVDVVVELVSGSVVAGAAVTVVVAGRRFGRDRNGDVVARRPTSRGGDEPEDGENPEDRPGHGWRPWWLRTAVDLDHQSVALTTTSAEGGDTDAAAAPPEFVGEMDGDAGA